MRFRKLLLLAAILLLALLAMGLGLFAGPILEYMEPILAEMF